MLNGKTRIIILLVLVGLISTVFAQRFPEARCGTVEIIKAINGLPSAFDPSYVAMKRIMRPTTTETYDTPEGHFKIHYDLTGYDAVDSVGYVHNLGRYLERSWAAYVDTMGYYPPPPDGGSGGDDKYDVYVRNFGYYGLTWIEDPGPYSWNDYTSYLEVHKDFHFASNDDPEGPVAGAMKVTCAHEFHHAVQFAYDGSCQAWLAELTSVSYEERLYPYVNDYLWFVDYMADEPHLPPDWGGGYHMYGMGVLGQYWSLAYGDSLMSTIWDTIRYVPDWDAVLAGCDIYGTDFGELMAEFAIRALLTGSRDGGFFPDGPRFPDMDIQRTHSSYPANGYPSDEPYGYGMSFVIFDNFGVTPSDLYIDFTGDSVDWFVKIAWITSDTLIYFDLPVSAGIGSCTVPNVHDADFVGMALIPAGNTSVRYDYSYTAELAPASVTESKLPSELAVTVAPNPFNSACRITFENIPAIPGNIEIFDINGVLIDKIGPNSVRTKSVLWNPEPELPSGVYFIRPAFTKHTHRVIYLK